MLSLEVTEESTQKSQRYQHKHKAAIPPHLLACACTCTYERCQAYGTDIYHSSQQANQLVNLALTDLMNLVANFRSTLKHEA